MASIPEDLPQMWQRPSYPEIISILQHLELSPPVWKPKRNSPHIHRHNPFAEHQEEGEELEEIQELEPDNEEEEEQSHTAKSKEEITRYLSSIVGSPLSWIPEDDQREEIWTLAGKRISERCGRTAMGEVVRRWPLDEGVAGLELPPLDLTIWEPALTGDFLGFKTWGSSFVLAQQLKRLSSTALFKLFDETMGQPLPEVLELGSGTGLLGIAAAALWGTTVYLSDLPEILPNLKRNADENEDLVEARGGSLKAGPLTWGGEGDDQVDRELFGEKNQFKIVLVADPLYDDNHPGLLASAVSQHLAFGSDARAVVMVPQRDHTTKLLRDAFKQAMLDLETPLFCEEEDELAGQDDWIEDGDGGQVKCWLGIFSRGGSPHCGLAD